MGLRTEKFTCHWTVGVFCDIYILPLYFSVNGTTTKFDVEIVLFFWLLNLEWYILVIQVLDAFKQGEKDGKTTKFGQPIVPKNIFDDVRQTQEEKDADKFSFNLRPGDIFLIFSFLLIIGLMLGTAFLVWKVGGIHYNE